jgi:hypothetical protein
VQEIDVSKLDMNDPEQRRIYREMIAKQSTRAKFF